MSFLLYWSEHKRNAIVSILAGSMFFIGWWIIFDVAAVYPNSSDFAHVYHLVGLAGTVGLVLVNIVPAAAVRGDLHSGRCCGLCCARTVLFFGFVFGFVALIAATWILFQFYAESESTKPIGAGLGMFFQNVLIFVASMLFKFGRIEDDSYF